VLEELIPGDSVRVGASPVHRHEDRAVGGVGQKVPDEMPVVLPLRDVVPPHLRALTENLSLEGLSVVLGELLHEVAEGLPTTALVEVSLTDLIHGSRCAFVPLATLDLVARALKALGKIWTRDSAVLDLCRSLLDAPHVELAGRLIPVSNGLLDLVDQLLNATRWTLAGGGEDVLRGIDAALLCALGDRHVARLAEGVVTHQLHLIRVGLLRMRAVHGVRSRSEHLDLGAVVEDGLLHQRRDDLGLLLAVVVEDPALQVRVGAEGLGLDGAECAGLAARLEARVQPVENGDQECLGAASICDAERGLDALEEEIGEELEGGVVVLADGHARDVDSQLVNQPGVQLVVVPRTFLVETLFELRLSIEKFLQLFIRETAQKSQHLLGFRRRLLRGRHHPPR
jgi:hypothetical protein